MSWKGNEATAQGQAGAAPAPREKEGYLAWGSYLWEKGWKGSFQFSQMKPS